MKALSIKQPWASLIVSGRKSIELRCWRTHHRGPLVILAGTREWKGEHAQGIDIGPRGVIVGAVDVVDCREFSRETDTAATCVPEKTLRELTYQAGLLGPKQWFSWVFANARTCRNIPLKGRLGFIDLDAATLRAAGLIF